MKKRQFFRIQPSSQSNLHIHTWALTIRIFVGKITSLIFYTLSRFVIDFLPRSNCLNFMTTVTICSNFGAPKNEVCHCFHCSPICLRWSDGSGCLFLVFWMMSFKSGFSISSFTFIKRLFSSSLFFCHKGGAICVSALLIFLPAILIIACASASVTFHIMYLVHKLNKQGDTIQPEVLLSQFKPVYFAMSGSNFASWLACNFLMRQVRWSGILISWRIFYSFFWSTHSKTLVLSMK